MQPQQPQQQFQRKVAPRTCSCCGETGHTIKHCNSPRVLGFDEEATATAKTAPSVLTLKNRRPFTTASLPVLKAIAANLRIETSVSNLTAEYLTHLLAFSYWNMHNDAGSHANIRDAVRLNELANACKQSAAQAERDAIVARAEEQAYADQQRQQLARQGQAHALFQRFRDARDYYMNGNRRIEEIRLETHQAYTRANLPIPQDISQPIVVMDIPVAGAPNETLCICCNLATHTIKNCKNYRGIPTMTKILATSCTKSEFRTRLQQHPNLYSHLAYAIQSKWVSANCCDCVLAMNKIADHYYQANASYEQVRMELQQYKIEYAFLQDTREALETNVIHDPRVKVYQSLLDITPKIQFHDMNETFIGKCIDIAEKLVKNMFTPIDITLGFKTSPACALANEDKDEDKDAKKGDEDKDEDAVNLIPSCAVCWGAWDTQYPIITFGCNHEMCSKCVNTYLKSPTRPVCHMCREPVCRIFVPTEAVNADLFEDIRIRILRQD